MRRGEEVRSFTGSLTRGAQGRGAEKRSKGEDEVEGGAESRSDERGSSREEKRREEEQMEGGADGGEERSKWGG